MLSKVKTQAKSWWWEQDRSGMFTAFGWPKAGLASS